MTVCYSDSSSENTQQRVDIVSWYNLSPINAYHQDRIDIFYSNFEFDELKWRIRVEVLENQAII